MTPDLAFSNPLRPGDLVADPTKYLNKSVELDIVEPLRGPSTPEALSSISYGQVHVDIPDEGLTEFGLVPAAFKTEDPNRFKKKFERVITGPVRVKGEFLEDPEMAKSMRRPYYVLRVVSIEPLALESPVAVRSLEEIRTDSTKWNRKFITYEGTYESLFETSALDKDIWVSFQNPQIIGQPSKETNGKRVDRVRVTGFLFAKPGARYGHLGGYPFEILVSKLEYLP